MPSGLPLRLGRMGRRIPHERGKGKSDRPPGEVQPLMRMFFRIWLIVFFIMGSPLAMASEKGGSDPSGPSASKKGSGTNPAAWFVSFYQEHISAVDGDRCPSLPSCASYSVKAFKKHGFFVGWMMTVDRLIHEGKGETSVSPMVLSEGHWKIYDPVENNDFWWYHPKREDYE